MIFLSGCFTVHTNLIGKVESKPSLNISGNFGLNNGKVFLTEISTKNFRCRLCFNLLEKVKNEPLLLTGNSNYCEIDLFSFFVPKEKSKYDGETYKDPSRPVIIDTCRIDYWDGNKLKFWLKIRDAGEDKKLNTEDDNCVEIWTKDYLKKEKEYESYASYIDRQTR